MKTRHESNATGSTALDAGDEVVLTETDMDADELFAALETMAKKLRETAAGLDDGTINKFHAANRLRKMARGIDGGK